MIDTIVNIFRIETSISINAFIYFLKKLPFVKNWLKGVNYTFLRFKSFIGICAVVLNLIKGLLKSGVVLFLGVILPGLISEDQKIWHPLTLVFFFYFLFRLLMSETLSLNMQKYIMVKQLRMNAGKYAKANLIKSEGIKLISRSLVFMACSYFLGVSPLEALFISFLVTMMAIVAEAIHLFVFKNTGEVLDDHTMITVILHLMIIFVAGFSYYVLNGFDAGKLILHPATVVMIFIMFVASIYFLRRYGSYTEALNRATNLTKLSKLQTTMGEAKFADVKIKSKDFEIKELSKEQHKEKEGYVYLNALFFDRHKRIIRKPVIIKSALVVLAFALIFGVCYFVESASLTGFLSEIIGGYTIFIFLMYMLCNSNRETRAMFYNCDLSMLRYGFYRKPGALIKMFTLRLTRIVLGNLLPTMLIIIGLLLVTLASGEGDYRELIPIILLLLSLSVFFSVHYIFMYYIFQPYTSTLGVKSPFFSIINGVVYLLSYMSMQIDEPAARFLTYIILFSIAYVIAALVLVYYKAPKTFRVK